MSDARSPKRTIRVRKASPVRKPKNRRTLRVARKAKPDDADLLEHLGSPAGNMGPRYDKDGTVLEYTILGKIKDYKDQNEDEFVNTSTVRLGTPNSVAGQNNDVDRPKTSQTVTELDHANEIRKSRRHAEEMMKKTYSMERVRLSKMTIADRLREKRQAQALKNYRKYQRDWGVFKKQMSAKLGKSADSLVVSKSEEYREVNSHHVTHLCSHAYSCRTCTHD